MSVTEPSHDHPKKPINQPLQPITNETFVSLARDNGPKLRSPDDRKRWLPENTGSYNFPIETRRRPANMSNEPPSSIKNVIAENRDRWLAIVGVEGVGEGRFHGEPCIKFFLSKKVNELPKAVDGFRVVTMVTGAVSKQSTDS